MDFDNDKVQDIMSIKETGTNVNVSFYSANKYTGNIVSQTVLTPLTNVAQYEVKKIGGL